MKHINLSSRTERDWSARFLRAEDFDQIDQSEDFTVFKPDGSMLMVYLRDRLPHALLKPAWAASTKINLTTNARATASGSKSRKWIRANGEVSKTTIGDPVESGLVGYFERTTRFPYCRACAFNLANPEEFSGMIPMAQAISDLFKDHCPDAYEYQKNVCDKTHPAWVIPGTVYSTITVNRNFRCAGHKDAGDLPSGRSAIIVIKEGHYTGGELVFPDFRVGVRLNMGDVLFFDPHEFHGNTPLVPLTDNAVRYSMVFYFREKVQFCGAPEEELQIVKNRQPGKPGKLFK